MKRFAGLSLVPGLQFAGAINNHSLQHQTKSTFQHASVAGAHSGSPQVFAHHIKSCILLKQLSHKLMLQSYTCVDFSDLSYVQCGIKIV